MLDEATVICFDSPVHVRGIPFCMARSQMQLRYLFQIFPLGEALSVTGVFTMVKSAHHLHLRKPSSFIFTARCWLKQKTMKTQVDWWGWWGHLVSWARELSLIPSVQTLGFGCGETLPWQVGINTCVGSVQKPAFCSLRWERRNLYTILFASSPLSTLC